MNSRSRWARPLSTSILAFVLAFSVGASGARAYGEELALEEAPVTLSLEASTDDGDGPAIVEDSGANVTTDVNLEVPTEGNVAADTLADASTDATVDVPTLTDTPADTDIDAPADTPVEPGLDSSANSEAIISANNAIPTAFDLRDVDGQCYVTPVKFQNPYGVCWGFAAISAAETSILATHFADDPEAYKTLDLSEKQLAFFAHTHIDDITHSQNGEGIYSIKYDIVDGKFVPVEPLTSEDYYTGGSVFLATNTFAAGAGPTLESRDDMLMYKGKDGTIIYLEDGTPYCYSPNDDWTLSEDYRYLQDYVLVESYILPTPAVWTTEGYSYNEDATNTLKDQLLQKRAVVIAFYADESLPWDTGYGLYMNTETWSHYTFGDPLPNHAVTIVGWDDNYDASNFAHTVYQLKDPSKGYEPSNFLTDESGQYVVDEVKTALATPPANGAWLIKNSWGSGEQDFPNNGGGDWGILVQKTDAEGNPVYDEYENPVMVGSGYFWLSYYDTSISSPETFIFDTALTGPGGAYDQSTLHCNQYDLMPVTGMQAKESEQLVKSANIFTTEDGEHVMCTSYITSTPNTTVTVDIYLLNNGFTSPEDGALLASHTETREHAGFFIDYLDGVPVHMQPGQTYSVVVTQQLASGSYAVDYPTNFGPFNLLIESDMANSFAVAIQHDESFVYFDGLWASWADEEARDTFLENYQETGWGEGITQKILNDYALVMQYDNFPIKVYAFDRIADVFVRLAGGAESLSTFVGDSVLAGLEIYGSDSEGLSIADYANEKGMESISWSLEKGSELLVKLMPSEDGTWASIKGLRAGVAYVVASIKNIGNVIIPVVVQELVPGASTNETPAQTDSSTTSTESEVARTSWSAPTASVAKLAKTGDYTPFGAMAVIACIGIVAVVAGIVISRRRS